ncbi:MAG: HAD family hydrolase [Candidatus Omnitrophica bacterium]|nr:HAD family hydrolase [Candidatus Omnitrophota bacterium]MDD5653270.1 HAD family hydrolase [Candidatus Omnitrophota bacterium]
MPKPIRRVKLVIFDLDGTLIDAFPAIIRSFNFIMRSLGYPLRDALTIRRAVGWGDSNLLKPFVPKKDLPRAAALYRRHHKQALLTGSRLYPGARKLLVYLKSKGYQLAVASNRPTAFSQIIIRRHHLNKFFAQVICADVLKKGKPHPQILKEIMRKLRFAPGETVFVGDMAIDAETARRAKVKAIIVLSDPGMEKKIRLEKPYDLIRRISLLAKLV